MEREGDARSNPLERQMSNSHAQKVLKVADEAANGVAKKTNRGKPTRYVISRCGRTIIGL